MYLRKNAYRDRPIYNRLTFGNFGRGGRGGPREMGNRGNTSRRERVPAWQQNSNRFTMPPRSRSQNNYYNFNQYEETTAKDPCATYLTFSQKTNYENVPSFRKGTQTLFRTNKSLNRTKVLGPRAYAQEGWETSTGHWDNFTTYRPKIQKKKNFATSYQPQIQKQQDFTTSYRPRIHKNQNYNIPQKISSKKRYESRGYNNPETYPQNSMGKNGKSYSYDYNWSKNGKQSFKMHEKSSGRQEERYYQPKTYYDYENTGKRNVPKPTRNHARNTTPLSCYMPVTAQKKMAAPPFYGHEYKNSYQNEISYRGRRTISDRTDFYHYFPDDRAEGYKPNYHAAYNYSYQKRHNNNATWADSANNYYSKPTTSDRICFGHRKTDCRNEGIALNRRIFSDNPLLNSYEQQWMLAHYPTLFYKRHSPVFMTMQTAACISSVSPQNSSDGYRLLHSQSVQNHGTYSRNAQVSYGCNRMRHSYCNRQYKQQYVVSPNCRSKYCPNALKHCSELPFTETVDLHRYNEKKLDNVKGFCQNQQCSPPDNNAKMLCRKEIRETEDSIEKNKGKSKHNGKTYTLPQIIVIGRETSETKTYIQEISKALKLSNVYNTNNESTRKPTLRHSAPTLTEKSDKGKCKAQNAKEEENEQQLRILRYVDSSRTAIKDVRSDKIYVLSDSKTKNEKELEEKQAKVYKENQAKVHEENNYKLQQELGDSDDIKSDKMYVLSDRKTKNKKEIEEKQANVYEEKQAKVLDRNNYKLQQEVGDSDDKSIKIRDNIANPFKNDDYQILDRCSFTRDNSEECLKNKYENFVK